MTLPASQADLRPETRTPSATVGMIGAGQLARMTQQAAITLDIELRVLTDDPEAPAVRAGATPVFGCPSRPGDLQALAAGCDVVTFDHELVDAALLTQLGKHATLRPSPTAKALAQDKLHARTTLAQAGFPVPPSAPVDTAADITAFGDAHGWPVVVKTRAGGYDGRGVWIIDGPRAAREICDSAHASGHSLLVEIRVAIERELAVLVARNPSGVTACYPVLETRQHEAICHEVIAPASIPAERAEEARRLALGIAERFDVTGLLAVELFLSPEGVVINELALRPHNSGHLTIDACPTSQFEQHLRAILDWPLGDTHLLACAAGMVNVLGAPHGPDITHRLPHALAVPQARIHLYGKTPRPGRKLGHITALGGTPEQALGHAHRAAAALVSR